MSNPVIFSRSLQLRLWLGVLGVVLSAGPAHAGRLRLMSGNITSGNFQSYDDGAGARIFQGVKPDVVLIQEFNFGNNSVSAIRSFVDTTFGTGFFYYREGDAQIANGIISRYPIVASGEWDDPQVANRDFAWARIDVPGDKDLWVVSVHLLTDTSKHGAEGAALKSFVIDRVPAGDYLVVGGDFNSDARNDAALSQLSTLVDTASPYPADKNGNPNTSASRAKPLDGIYVDADLNALKTPVVIGSSTFTNGLVVDTRVYTPLSEISPALVGDSGAAQMQHMAVVKDFQLPEPPPADPAELPLLKAIWSGAGPSSLELTFRSTAGAPYEVQASMTLAPPAGGGSAWTALGQITASTTTTTVTVVTTAPAGGQVQDTGLGMAVRRFYRIVRV